MALTATVRFGRVPHPSLAEVDFIWLHEELQSEASFVSVSENGNQLGVLQVMDSQVRSLDLLFVDPRAWLERVPAPGSDVELAAASDQEFLTWRRTHTRGRRARFWIALALTVAAGLIELSWSVGKYWPIIHPNDTLSALSQILKWALVGLGVAGLTAYKDYRAIE